MAECLKGGRKCSGAAAAIFLNTDSNFATTSTFAARDVAERPRDESKNKKTISAKVRLKSASDKHEESLDERSVTETPSPTTENIMTPPPKDLLLQLRRTNSSRNASFPTQVDSSHVITYQLLSCFVYFYAWNSGKTIMFNTWMGHLPGVLSRTKSQAVSNSLIATSMVHCGSRWADQRILTEAYRWYGAGISNQRKMLLDMNKNKREPSFEELCAPFLLAFFEVARCTSHSAYFHHLLGAANLLGTFGPERCKEGALFDLFLTMRLQLIYPTVVMRIPSVLGKPEWLSVPFFVRKKTAMDKTIDIYTVGSELLWRIDALKASSVLPDLQAAALEKEDIQARGQSLLSDLDSMWEGKNLREFAQAQGWSGDSFNGMSGFDPSALNRRRILSAQVTDQGEGAGGNDESTPPEMSLESLTACSTLVRLYAASPAYGLGPSNVRAAGARLISFYSAARLLVLSILDQVDVRSALFEEQVGAHAESVLSVAEWLDGMDIGYAYLRLVTPLHIVYTTSHMVAHKRRVVRLLMKWMEISAVAGICEIALRSLNGVRADGVEGEFVPSF
ncbi:hypothetical protein B0O99DRAFT_213140 [Bisporella sp. PMI_857]|nr:hypothetical protein B0O99DRAFT_213140 [Bisporella sp. PMI_857]